MRVMFTIQGQGRGHLTQALATEEILRDAGHEVAAVVAGHHPGRPLADSFVESFSAPVVTLPSPGFVFRADRGVDMAGTIGHGLRHTRLWARSVQRLGELVESHRPDLVVNFFEPLTGLLQAVRPLAIPVAAVAHQFALLGSRWGAPPLSPTAPLWLRAFIRFVGCRSWKLALSFAAPSHPGTTASRKSITVAPPLLRRRVLDLVPSAGDYVLVYLATHGYGQLVRAWHEAHPSVRIHCFYDRPEAPDVELVSPGLTFHRLDAQKFLTYMAACRAVVCTAGFESICEAAFLGKPVLMIPLENHQEQALNALDGEASGVAVAHPVFDLDALSRLPERVARDEFRAWCLEAPERLLQALERLGSAGGRAAQ